MHLIIFDIDGTLIHTHAHEGDCFAQALFEITGITDIERGMEAYEHVTDEGIARQCIRTRLDREATQHELDLIEQRFCEILSDSLINRPPQPIKGAQALLQYLSEKPDTALAIATGSYAHSACLKLRHSDFAMESIDSLPMGSCNDHYQRVVLMQAALEKAKKLYNTSHFDSIIYVGDGPWDAKAVQTLGWGFIGVASHLSKAALLSLGAQAVVENYLEHPFF